MDENQSEITDKPNIWTAESEAKLLKLFFKNYLVDSNEISKDE